MDKCYMCKLEVLDDVAYKCHSCYVNICLCSHCLYTVILPNYPIRHTKNGMPYKVIRCCFCHTPTIEEYVYEGIVEYDDTNEYRNY